MFNTGGIRVLKINNVPIELHSTFGLIVAWGGWQGWVWYGGREGIAYGFIGILVLFASVLIHEIGHALAASGFDLTVHRITLLPTGGFAQVESPPYPWQEILIALSGPVTNLFVALAFGGLVYSIEPLVIRGWVENFQYLKDPGLMGTLRYIVWANLSLFLFNMLPAFPMDGGRILRASFATFIEYETATRIASWLGRAAALSAGIGALVGEFTGLYDTNPVFVIIAVIVYFGTWQEEVTVRRRRALLKIEAGEIARFDNVYFSPQEQISQDIAANLLHDNKVVPVLLNKRIVGLISYQDLQRRHRKMDYPVAVSHIMRSTFPVVSSRETLWVAMTEMIGADMDVLPVLQGQQFLGIIELHDIKNAWRISTRQRKNKRSY